MTYCGGVNTPTTDNTPLECDAYYDTNCVLYTDPIPYFGTVDPSTSTQVFDMVITSLSDINTRVFSLEEDILNVGGQVLNTPLTGLTAGTNISITDTNTILEAFANLQAQQSAVISPTGLEAIDEGNGIGWVPIGADRTSHGVLGLNALDFSLPWTDTEVGAMGEESVVFGEDNKGTGGATLTHGFGNLTSDNYSITIGAYLTNSSYASALFGYQNTLSGSNVFYGFGAGANNQFNGSYGGGVGLGLINKSFSTFVVGQGNEDYTNTNSSLNVATAPHFIVGNGDATAGNPNNVSTRSTAFSVLHNGMILAPSLTEALIDVEATGRALTTKEWVLANSGGEHVGLGAIDEGNGIGWRLTTTLPKPLSLPIGLNAVDFSISPDGESGPPEYGASGESSLAHGLDAIASGLYSVVLGGGTASATNAVAINGGASAFMSFAVNGSVTPIASKGIAINGTAHGIASVAIGPGSDAYAAHEVVLGTMADSPTDSSPNTWVLTDRAFSVGNGVPTTIGTAGGSRSDAFVILKNGLITAPSLTTAFIDAEVTGKALITKEWFNANTDDILPPALQKEVTAATYTITDVDNGYTIWFNNATGVTVTIDTLTTENFECDFYNEGAGNVTFQNGTATVGYPDGTTLATDKVASFLRKLSTTTYKLKGELT